MHDEVHDRAKELVAQLTELGWFRSLPPFSAEIAVEMMTGDKPLAYDDSDHFDFGDDEWTPANCLHGIPRALFDRERIYRQGDYTYLLNYFREASYGLLSPYRIREEWRTEDGHASGLVSLSFLNDGKEYSDKFFCSGDFVRDEFYTLIDTVASDLSVEMVWLGRDSDIGHTLFCSQGAFDKALEAGLFPSLKQGISTSEYFAAEFASPRSPTGTRGKWRYDVFISHASEDKDRFVRNLAGALEDREIRVWYDEFELKPGDSLRRSIDRGLGSSRLGVVVLSPSFLRKNWTQYELDGLVARDVDGRNVIVPIWLDITRDQILAFSPPLADKVAIVTQDNDVQETATRIARLV